MNSIEHKKGMRKPHHVLLVEDDKTLREHTGQILEIGGYRVTGADNGVVALKFLLGAPIDLVITDVHMPLMDGVELAQQMEIHFPRIPVIVVTGSKNSMERLTGKTLPNVRKILRKPVSLDALISTVVEIFTKPKQ